jgi:hypothetical protein
LGRIGRIELKMGEERKMDRILGRRVWNINKYM